MLTILLITFLIVLALNIVSGDSNYIYFSRVITWVNSMKKSGPVPAIDVGSFIVAEYTVRGKPYGVLIRKDVPLNWCDVGAEIEEDQWVDVTAKVSYYAGPFRNFHLLTLRPLQIDPRFRKLGFRFQDGSVIHVGGNEIIFNALKAHAKNTTHLKESKAV